jgi:hypothetical protein
MTLQIIHKGRKSSETKQNLVYPIKKAGVLTVRLWPSLTHRFIYVARKGQITYTTLRFVQY